MFGVGDARRAIAVLGNLIFLFRFINAVAELMSGQRLMSGMGELHLDVVISRLKTENRVTATSVVKKPLVPCIRLLLTHLRLRLTHLRLLLTHLFELLFLLP